MAGRRSHLIEPPIAALAIALGLAPAALAQRAPLYPRMASVAEYLMPDRNAEVGLARSAAPTAISGDASIMVLGQRGYEPASEGRNGFVCLVERSWMSPFDSPEFWNPRIRSPVCYNPAGARSVLPGIYRRTQLALAGLSKEQIVDSIRLAFLAHALPSPAPGAMSFMMSKMGYLNDEVGHWRPHLMFDVPKSVNALWGENVTGSPILLQQDTLDPIVTEFMVPVGRWSDGTPAAFP